MLDDSISTKKEEKKNKINKITGNKTHKYSKWLKLQGNWKGTYK